MRGNIVDILVKKAVLDTQERIKHVGKKILQQDDEISRKKSKAYNQHNPYVARDDLESGINDIIPGINDKQTSLKFKKNRAKLMLRVRGSDRRKAKLEAKNKPVDLNAKYKVASSRETAVKWLSQKVAAVFTGTRKEYNKLSPRDQILAGITKFKLNNEIGYGEPVGADNSQAITKYLQGISGKVTDDFAGTPQGKKLRAILNKKMWGRTIPAKASMSNMMEDDLDRKQDTGRLTPRNESRFRGVANKISTRSKMSIPGRTPIEGVNYISSKGDTDRPYTGSATAQKVPVLGTQTVVNSVKGVGGDVLRTPNFINEAIRKTNPNVVEASTFPGTSQYMYGVNAVRGNKQFPGFEPHGGSGRGVRLINKKPSLAKRLWQRVSGKEGYKNLSDKTEAKKYLSRIKDEIRSSKDSKRQE